MLYELHVEAFKHKPEQPVESLLRRTEERKFGRTEYFVAEIALRNAEIVKLESERSGLMGELGRVKEGLSESESRVKALESERSGLMGELGRVKGELSEIEHSFGYTFMKFYASHVDRLFPDGTYRGELRKRVAAGLGMIRRRETSGRS